MEINQYDITMATYYDITMGNDIVRDAYCEITMGNGVARDIHCDVTMSNDIAMYKYHGITMYNNVAMKHFYCVLSALCLIMILLRVLWNKNKNMFIFYQSGLENKFIIFCVGLSLHKHNSCVLPRLIKHSLFLVIIWQVRDDDHWY